MISGASGDALKNELHRRRRGLDEGCGAGKPSFSTKANPRIEDEPMAGSQRTIGKDELQTEGRLLAAGRIGSFSQHRR